MLIYHAKKFLESDLDYKNQEIILLKQKNNALEREIIDLKKEHEIQIQNLIHTQPGIRNRMSVYDNLQSQQKVANFDVVIKKSNINIQILRNALKSGSDGDLLLFKKIFFEDLPKESRCIRVRDFARDKYQVFDGKEWLTVTLNHIAEEFMKQVFELYKPVINEKHSKLEEINKKYPRWKYKEKNRIEYNKISDLYAIETEHFGNLATMNNSHLVQIKTGIRSMISADKSLVSTKEDLFK